ncbi:TOG domain-containing protein [Mycena indigotica]|uniref:TOG domain-containing protein n=1 Tax=Mycena indigotica TaxID=2126181 RepID=A0A8H6TB89_9AGAR|nr:TOG domain-containing protein [Mycena indigotica]KAF7315328.1 TOG domain-containing protein [Mycena indigotica]
MSIRDHIDSLAHNLSLTETEETWDTILRAINSLSLACANTDSYDPTDLVSAIRPLYRPIINAMNSERGRLSGAAIDLVGILASSLGVAFDPLLHHLFPVLLALSSRTSKVTMTRARTCILTVIDATQLPTILSYLLQSAADKSISLRVTVVESTLACLNCFNPPDLEKESKAKEIEAIIRVAARDASGDVRKVGRKMFDAYKILLPDRVERFIAPLSPTSRKYLDIQPKPSSSKTLGVPMKQPQLSSSTSAMKPSTLDKAKTHMRSASSPAVAPQITRPVAQPERPKPVEVVVPPKVTGTIPPSRHAPSKSTLERKRVISMSAARTRIETDSTTQPIPTTSQPVRRVVPAQQAVPVVVTGPQRILISDSKPLDKAGPHRGRVISSVSTPALRIASTAPPPPKPTVTKPALRSTTTTAGPSSKRVPVSQLKSSPQKTVSKHKEPVKNSLMKPTLAQLARAKAIEKRVAAVATGEPSRAERRAPRKAPLPSRKVNKPVVEKEKEPSQVIAEEEAPADEPENAEKTDEQPAAEDKLQEDEEIPKVSVESLDLATPPRTGAAPNISVNKTPISELLLSIERGFLFTPSAPLSPPDSYLNLPPVGAAIPFPIPTTWPHATQQQTSLKPFEVVRQLDSRKALGNVETNKERVL